MFDSLGASSSSCSSSSMNGLHFLPPGYRFHPTDEELVKYYLANKVSPLDEGHRLGSVFAIVEVDLNKCEPWDLPDQAKIGEKEWYFYSLRDRKYPTGLRTNRATEAGYWKATGKDRLISNTDNGHLIGMKKTLVFYLGRAPKGEKTHWIMHEYRLSSQQKPPSVMPLLPKEEWVISRVFKKNHSSSSGTNNITNELITRHNLCLRNESENNATNCLPSLLDSPNTMAEEIHNPKQEQDYASLFNHPSQSSSMSSSLMLNYPVNPDLNPPTNSANPYSAPSINVLKALLDHYSCSVSADPKIQYPSSVNTILNPWSDMATTQVHAHAPVNLSLNQMESGFLGGDMTDINRAREYNHLEAYGLY